MRFPRTNAALHHRKKKLLSDLYRLFLILRYRHRLHVLHSQHRPCNCEAQKPKCRSHDLLRWEPLKNSSYKKQLRLLFRTPKRRLLPIRQWVDLQYKILNRQPLPHRRWKHRDKCKANPLTSLHWEQFYNFKWVLRIDGPCEFILRKHRGGFISRRRIRTGKMDVLRFSVQ